jgi:hypothetical protein
MGAEKDIPEVTPEMVEAGAQIILDHCEELSFADAIARDVFKAMMAASPSKSRVE